MGLVMSDKEMKAAFDDFMQDTYDEEELQYMDSGFSGALEMSFRHGWQASRQALVVELPHTVYRGDYLQDGTSNLEWEEYYEIDEVKLSLDSAGIKWKE